jgi:hypothetical protein
MRLMASHAAIVSLCERLASDGRVRSIQTVRLHAVGRRTIGRRAAPGGSPALTIVQIELLTVRGVSRLAELRRLPKASKATVQGLALRLLALAARHLQQAATIWQAAACAALAAEAVMGRAACAGLIDDLGFAVNCHTASKHLAVLRSKLAELGASLGIHACSSWRLSWTRMNAWRCEGISLCYLAPGVAYDSAIWSGAAGCALAHGQLLMYIVS